MHSRIARDHKRLGKLHAGLSEVYSQISESHLRFDALDKPGEHRIRPNCPRHSIGAIRCKPPSTGTDMIVPVIVVLLLAAWLIEKWPATWSQTARWVLAGLVGAGSVAVVGVELWYWLFVVSQE